MATRNTDCSGNKHGLVGTKGFVVASEATGGKCSLDHPDVGDASKSMCPRLLLDPFGVSHHGKLSFPSGTVLGRPRLGSRARAFPLQVRLSIPCQSAFRVPQSCTFSWNLLSHAASHHLH